jgi:hypothetical protein
MNRKPTRTQKFFAELLPIFYGFIMAFVAVGILVGAILLYGHDSAQANPTAIRGSGMISTSKTQPQRTEELLSIPAATESIPPVSADIGEATPAPPAVSSATSPAPPPQTPKPATPPTPPPAPWKWTALRDDVALLFRTELPDIGGLPLLHYATLLDDEDWVSELISRGADANETTPGGDTTLCAAVRLGAAKSVRALLYGGADVTAPGFEKQPPLPLASLRRGTDIYRALLAAGADPNSRFASPITKAVLDRVTIKDLKNALESDRGVTPLIACASRGDVEGAAELMRWGASASKCTTRYHRYPINFAATQGYLFLMRIILGRQPESEPVILVTIDLSKQRAWVTKEGKLIDTCPVSTGREGYRTPAGRYVITDKHRSWTSTLYHVAMPFFMRLNCSAIGLHSGYVTGRPASHGCIRLPYEKARKFFSICNVGDEVQIVH